MYDPINVIDLFAGPGGLGEGFSAYQKNGRGYRPFQIRMSVEKEASAHKTLTLRALYRSLRTGRELEPYNDYILGNIPKEELIHTLPEQWDHALEETLFEPTALGEDNEKIHARLRKLKNKYRGNPWVVIGGPPCQAYSLAGRSRNRGIKDYRPEKDKRHFLYKEYLQVLHELQPEIFVMENVKGILTSKVEGKRIFPTILEDLKNPSRALGVKHSASGKEYRIYSLVTGPSESGLFGPIYSDDRDYVINAEKFGIPQSRHRVILLGVSTEISKAPSTLTESPKIPIQHILTGLPKLRSKLSKQQDSPENWYDCIWEQLIRMKKELKSGEKSALFHHMQATAYDLRLDRPTSSRRYARDPISSKVPGGLRNWLLKDRPDHVLNHEARGHMEGDLGRYFFSACWADFYGGDKSLPKAKDFPECLAPAHANWKSGHFADRFKVQQKDRPATTITSHISKDGHYFIHYDPKQCRSLTVREAARIQTFPDNYFFEGNRTQQYVQVGNAVPPYLAYQLAKVVFDLIS